MRKLKFVSLFVLLVTTAAVTGGRCWPISWSRGLSVYRAVGTQREAGT